MIKYILLLILTSTTVFSTGSDGTSGDKSPSSDSEVVCFKIGSDGSNGEQDHVICVLKGK